MVSRNNAASANKNRNGRQPAAGPRRAAAIVKPRPTTGARKSARLQGNDPQPQPIQAPISNPAGVKRKRLQESEVETDEPKSGRPAKQPRRLLPPLSVANLQKFNGGEINSATNNARIKRSSSQRSVTASSDVTQDTARSSQRSSGTTAYYRFNHLAAAEVYIHTDPPPDIQKALDAIVKPKILEERLAELRAIAKEFSEGCRKTVKAAVGKDDFIELLLIALRAMNHSSLCLRAKADWRVELKPTVQQSDLNWSFLPDPNFVASDQRQDVNDASAPPRKRQQQNGGQTYISPGPSRTDATDSMPANKPLESNTMPPPETRPDHSAIKTPRPDISLGTEGTALISALSSQNLDDTNARRFLAQLQEKMIHRERGRPEEPVLTLTPTQRASDLVIPFAVVEGKAYSTGKQVFEAENQAAVSAACGLKIQLCLDELVEHATASSDILPTPSNTTPPLFFTICTEGPVHELWANYTTIQNGVRKFDMALLKICHGVLLETVVELFVAMDNVLRWGTGKLLNPAVERLGKVAKRAGA